jgi:MFS family permease
MSEDVVGSNGPAEKDQEAVLSSPAGGNERRWKVAFRALRHRNFRLFFGGQLTSLIGTWMQTVAQAWLVLKLTNSPLMLGLVTFARFAPMLVVALFAGVIVDHVDRRRLLILSQSLLMLSAFILAALTWTGVVRVEHVIILAAFNGLVGAFDAPGRQSFVVEMVGIEDLPNAIALNSLIFNGARAIGPAVAGVLIAWTGIAMCFFLNGVSFLAVIWSLFAMDLPRKAAQSMGASMLRRLHEGLAYVWGHRPSFYLLLIGGICNGFGVQYTVLLPVFARNILHGDAGAYGMLMGAQGAGAVVGAVILASRSATTGSQRQNLMVGLLVAGVGILVFGMSRDMRLSLVAQTIIGAALINYMASTNTLLQMFVSDELRGRVMSLYTISFIGAAPLGALEVGFIGEHLSPEFAVEICGAIALLCGLFMLTRMRTIAQARAAVRVLSPTTG